MSGIETTGSRWKGLYRVGGAAALITAVFLPIQVAVFVVWPPPLEGTAIDWFRLFQDNRLVGLLDLDLLLVADSVLLIPIFLALYFALRRASESFAALATALGFLGIAAFIASNPAVEMLSLSGRYTAATTETQRSMFLAAGQALLAGWQGTAFQVAYVVGSVAGLTISAVMLRSNAFSRVTAYMGILANVIALGLYVPTVGLYISVFSVLFLWIWYILIARRLLQLARL